MPILIVPEAPDVRVVDSGSIVLLTPLSAAAQDWFDEHLPEDRPMLAGATAVEPRYVDSILDGLGEEGLTCGA